MGLFLKKNELKEKKSNIFLYFCSMKKELGKWFLDICKYLITAVFISNIFSDMKYSPVLAVVGVLVIVITFVLGVMMIDDTPKYNKFNKKKR